jgi:hypothetical protein
VRQAFPAKSTPSFNFSANFNSALYRKCQFENAINPSQIGDRVKSKLEIKATLSFTAKLKHFVANRKVVPRLREEANAD